jgi:hypothetical protein
MTARCATASLLPYDDARRGRYFFRVGLHVPWWSNPITGIAVLMSACAGQLRLAFIRILESLAAAAFVLVFLPVAARLHAETVQVKYRGEVNLEPFACTDVTRSSFIYRVCFDKANDYMLINFGRYVLSPLRDRRRDSLDTPERGFDGSLL